MHEVMAPVRDCLGAGVVRVVVSGPEGFFESMENLVSSLTYLKGRASFVNLDE